MPHEVRTILNAAGGPTGTALCLMKRSFDDSRASRFASGGLGHCSPVTR